MGLPGKKANMRWVTYVANDGTERAGLVDGENVRGLEAGTSLLDILDGEGLKSARHRALEAPAEVNPLKGLDLRAPLMPRSLRDSTGFIQHLRNCNGPANLPISDRYKRLPHMYMANHTSVVGPYDDVAISPNCEQFDFELEIAAVIGKKGSNIPFDRADEYIVGYTLLNDWSARDLQIDEMTLGLGNGKGKDGANTLGPMLVTPDELASAKTSKGYDLRMTAYINGDLVSEGNWSTIDWDFPDLVSFASRGTTLRPGDVIGSGTVPSGCLLEQLAMSPDDFRGYLKPGDEVSIEVERLGATRQKVLAASTAPLLSSGY